LPKQENQIEEKKEIDNKELPFRMLANPIYQ
jgi:hypothetical protein